MTCQTGVFCCLCLYEEKLEFMLNQLSWEERTVSGCCFFLSKLQAYNLVGMEHQDLFLLQQRPKVCPSNSDPLAMSGKVHVLL